jgi:hypothetical protein
MGLFYKYYEHITVASILRRELLKEEAAVRALVTAPEAYCVLWNASNEFGVRLRDASLVRVPINRMY